MKIPNRVAKAIDDDTVRTRDQVRQLGQPKETPSLVGELDERLLARRAEGKRPLDALEFDIVDRAGGGTTLVTTRGLVVVLDGVSEVEVKEILGRDFVAARVGRRKRKVDARAVLFRFTGAEEGRSNMLDRAIAKLDRITVTARREMVTALHTVVKSADGPARAAVMDSETFPRAGASVARKPLLAVIDTGIAKRKRKDGWLNEVKRSNNIDPLDVFEHRGRLDFAAGHGTFVAGVVRQVAPHVRIKVYRALDSDGLGSEQAVADAMLRAARDKADVINLSLGMVAQDPAHPCPLMRVAVETILAKGYGPAIIASAGNDGTTHPMYPAAFPGVVGVAALKGPPHHVPASWSSHGAWVRCSTVGEGIVSTYVPGTEDRLRRAHPRDPNHPNDPNDPNYPNDPANRAPDTYPKVNPWALWSGTSFAAPQIAALVAAHCVDGRRAQDVVEELFPEAGKPTDGWGHRRTDLLPGTPTA